MSRVIYKYPMPAGGVSIRRMPQGFKPLSVGLDPQGAICMWAEVDTEAPPVRVAFVGIGTGWKIDELTPSPDSWIYMGTVNDGAFYMWHYYYTMEVPENDRDSKCS